MDYIITVRVTRVNPTSSTIYDSRTLLDYVKQDLAEDNRIKVLELYIKEAK